MSCTIPAMPEDDTRQPMQKVTAKCPLRREADRRCHRTYPTGYLAMNWKKMIFKGYHIIFTLSITNSHFTKNIFAKHLYDRINFGYIRLYKKLFQPTAHLLIKWLINPSSGYFHQIQTGQVQRLRSHRILS